MPLSIVAQKHKHDTLGKNMAGAHTAGQIHRVEGLQRLDVPRGCAESDDEFLRVIVQLDAEVGRGTYGYAKEKQLDVECCG